MKLYDNKYIFIKDLGNGGFGKVFLAKERVSNRFVAIKQLLTENKFLHISSVFERDFAYDNKCALKYGDYKKGTFSIYINGFSVLRKHDFIEVIPHELDVEDKFQEGVPFNFSFGGNIQGKKRRLHRPKPPWIALKCHLLAFFSYFMGVPFRVFVFNSLKLHREIFEQHKLLIID